MNVSIVYGHAPSIDDVTASRVNQEVTLSISVLHTDEFVAASPAQHAGNLVYREVDFLVLLEASFIYHLK